MKNVESTVETRPTRAELIDRRQQLLELRRDIDVELTVIESELGYEGGV